PPARPSWRPNRRPRVVPASPARRRWRPPAPAQAPHLPWTTSAGPARMPARLRPARTPSMRRGTTTSRLPVATIPFPCLISSLASPLRPRLPARRCHLAQLLAAAIFAIECQHFPMDDAALLRIGRRRQFRPQLIDLPGDLG